MYDVIVIGARVAGSSTAMLLARNGLSVLAVDKATFPSDTLSTHQVQLPGIARLERWGLLREVAAAGTLATRRVRFDAGPAVLNGHYGEFEGIDALYSPRRTLLDTLLVEAARADGAEVRERFTVDEIVIEDGRVTGIRGHQPGAGAVSQRARAVVGADGRYSLLAKAVSPRAHNEQRALTFAYYTYWDGVGVDGGEMYGRERRMIGVWPTTDGLVMTYVAGPIDEFHSFRSDLEGNLLASLDLAGGLGQRARRARRATHLRHGEHRQLHARAARSRVGAGRRRGLGHGPGDRQGISDALRDSELLADALTSGLGGAVPLDKAMRRYHRKRDQAVKARYKFTIDIASLRPPGVEQQLLFKALETDPVQTQRFLGVLTGRVPISQFFGPSNLRKLIGLRGFAKIAASRVRPSRAAIGSEEHVAAPAELGRLSDGQRDATPADVQPGYRDRAMACTARGASGARRKRVGTATVVTDKGEQMVALLVLLGILVLFGGLGFAAHFLWIVLVVALALWVIGFFVGGVESGIGRRRWYGRW